MFVSTITQSSLSLQRRVGDEFGAFPPLRPKSTVVDPPLSVDVSLIFLYTFPGSDTPHPAGVRILYPNGYIQGHTSTVYRCCPRSQHVSLPHATFRSQRQIRSSGREKLRTDRRSDCNGKRRARRATADSKEGPQIDEVVQAILKLTRQQIQLRIDEDIDAENPRASPRKHARLPSARA
jgi:hypothetical protein